MRRWPARRALGGLRFRSEARGCEVIVTSERWSRRGFASQGLEHPTTVEASRRRVSCVHQEMCKGSAPAQWGGPGGCGAAAKSPPATARQSVDLKNGSAWRSGASKGRMAATQLRSSAVSNAPRHAASVRSSEWSPFPLRSRKFPARPPCTLVPLSTHPPARALSYRPIRTRTTSSAHSGVILRCAR